ncbi:hypothetical protein BRD17_08840 [Halobacteriales archaeon SW_7_68_16]|nr:MAG: hypothetical protein BRD17_08840 [Halobacteriales archaeon SW_7_68_16]
MSPWECAIGDDDMTFDRLPDGYFAIRHAFDEHSRAEYVRAYDATASEVRRRESVKEAIEDEADIREVIARLEDSDEAF